MSWTPEQSAIRITRQLEEEIASASPEQLKAIFGRAALEQGLVERDSVNPQLLHPTALSQNSPKRFAKTIIVDGQKHILEAASPEELLDAESEFLRQALEKGGDEQARDAQGRFVHEQTPEEKAAGELQAANRAELELRFKRGDITAEAYLESSGAIHNYLAEHGMNPEALTAVSDLVYQNTWQSATEAFLNSEAGADWPGGDANMALAAQILEQSPELLNQPSADALAAVWNHMKENNLALPNPETEAHNAIADATDMESIRAALGRPSSSGMFDRR